MFVSVSHSYDKTSRLWTLAQDIILEWEQRKKRRVGGGAPREFRKTVTLILFYVWVFLYSLVNRRTLQVRLVHLIVIAVPQIIDVIKVIPEGWMSRSWMCQCRRSWRKSLRLSLAGARRQHGWTCMPVRRTVPGRGENGRSPRRAQPVAAALFDDAAWTSLLEVLLVFTSFQDTRHDLPFSSAFLAFSSSADLPVVLSLLCCLPSNTDFVGSLRLSLVCR